MAIISRSDKLLTATPNTQTKMASGHYALLRILHEADSYTLMTATANEDDNSYFAYPDLEKLVAVAESAIGRGERHADNRGRPYFLCRGIEQPGEIRDLANKIAQDLELPGIDEPWADEELREIYNEFSDGCVDEEPAYLADGVYIDKRGRLSF